MTDVKLDSRRRKYDIITNTLLVIAVGIAGWALTKAVDHEIRITKIESNRFTSQNGLDIWREIYSIREAMAKIPVRIPPEWFEKRVNILEEKLENHQLNGGHLKGGRHP